MNAPPFPANPAVGERSGQWVWNGARWVCAPTTGIAVLTQVFNTSGPYMPSPGLVSLVVESVGGGGGGGGAAVQNPTWALGGGGGGAGGYSRKTLPAALVLGGVNVIVGQGGSSARGAPGGNGGTTSFGALCVANGGFGGDVNDLAQQAGAHGWGGGGNGGDWTTAIGDLVSGGNGGGEGSYEDNSGGASIAIFGGIGGGGPWGGAAPVQSGVISGEYADGQNGQGQGAGASGGAVDMVVATAAGGVGGTGVCIVTEYCWADAASGDCDTTANVNARVEVTHGGHWSGLGGFEEDGV